MNKQTRQSGFTILELLVVVPTFLLVIAALIGFLVDLYGQLLVKDSQVTMSLQSQDALNSIQDDMFFARNFAERPNTSMVDAQGPGGTAQGWYFKTTPNATLVVYQVALDRSYQDPNRQPVYQRASVSGNSCDPDDIELNPPVLTNLIYYIDAQNRLRRRTLVPDPVHPRCSEPHLKQSCPSDMTRQQVNADSSTSVVPCSSDSVLAEGVTAFTIEYYDADGNLINMDTGSPLQAERITIKLTLGRLVQAQQLNYTSELSIKKVNRGDPDIQ